VIKAKHIELTETCGACPEQYDAMHNGERVGYLRLRWGWLTVTCPWVGGEVVYEHDFGDEWQGSFDGDEQRKKHLKKARKAIARWLSTPGNRHEL
jgi:hypothetical protein